MKKTFLTEDEKSIVKRGREHITQERESSARPPVSAVMNEISRLFLIAVKQTVEDSSLIRHSRMGILRYLEKNDRASQQDIAKYCYMSAPTISAELSDMEREGLISRQHSDVDGRTMLVSITDKGRALNEKIRNAFMRSEDIMFSDIANSDRESVSDLLLLMRSNILEYIEKNESEGRI